MDLHYRFHNMKTKFYLIIGVLSALTLSSCRTTFYQVYRAVPSDRSMANKEAQVYEDDNCEVTYNLWRHEGNMGFGFFNKSKENIYVNLDECYFVQNGVASDLLKPDHHNDTKRVIKSPKLFFYDTGLAATLLEIEDERQISTHFLRGGFFENMVINQLIKSSIR